MSWRKHFQIPQTANELLKAKQGQNNNGHVSANKFASWLKDVYSGAPNRVDRYTQYEQMDADSEINAALDTIAEFCTQFDYETNLPFSFEHFQDPTDAEVKVLTSSLRQWCLINDWKKRLWRTVRNTIKYGDQFFIRDPETYELHYVNSSDVTKIVINESKGKEVEQYIVRNISLNVADKVATDPIHLDKSPNAPQFTSASFVQYASGASGRTGQNPNEEIAVNADHVVHLSLTEGLDNNYPFGVSVLESCYKVFQQKSLLEDSIIIYRVQRAPERRIFYIDVGNMPANMAMSFVERVKNEIHQKRMPSRTGGGANIMDASYNPLSMLEDYFFAQTADGRGSKVETLPGGDNLGQIDDLKFFTNKMMRALRIPSSYLPTGPDDGTAVYNDGRVGTAYIQEYRFNKYCQRIQQLLVEALDNEFKMFLKSKGIEIDSSTFTLSFCAPQSFSEYREIEVNNARAAVFTQLAEVPYISRRFALKKYLGLTDQEIVDNEQKWSEENPDGVVTPDAGLGMTGGDLNSVGVEQPTEDDMGMLGDLENPPEEGEMGGPAGPEATNAGNQSPVGGTPNAT
jgi:hypothetical protein